MGALLPAPEELAVGAHTEVLGVALALPVVQAVGVREGLGVRLPVPVVNGGAVRPAPGS